MEWYQYIACFFSGLFLANVVPHYIQGVSGNKFPTPFAKPPGKGLSSPVTNVLWSFFNLLVGYLLFKKGHVRDNNLSLLIFFLGIALISLFAANHFQHKDKE